MLDRVLIILQNDITNETVLAVLSALQAFEQYSNMKNESWNILYKDTRKLDLQISLVVPNEEHRQIYQRCLNHITDIYHSMDEVGGNWTYACTLSAKEAEDLGSASVKYLAMAMGIIIGSEASELPNVTALCPAVLESCKDVLVDARLNTYTERIMAKTTSVTFVDFDTLSIEDTIQLVFGHTAVIGYSSFATYLASSLQKPVTEIQRRKDLMKWNNKKYICLTDDEPFFVEKGIDKCLTMVAG